MWSFFKAIWVTPWTYGGIHRARRNPKRYFPKRLFEAAMRRRLRHATRVWSPEVVSLAQSRARRLAASVRPPWRPQWRQRSFLSRSTTGEEAATGDSGALESVAWPAWPRHDRGARAGDRPTARRAGHGLCPYYETQFRFYPRLTSLEADPLDTLFADQDAA